MSVYYYQWLDDGSPIPGATNSTYVVQADDLWQSVQSQVKACTPDACASGYTTSSNAIAPEGPNTPTNLSPVDGDVVQTTTPTLSATYSDRSGYQGYVSYSIYTDPGNQLVASNSGPTVASGQTSAWTLSTALSNNQSYCYYAQAGNSIGESSGVAGPDLLPRRSASAGADTDLPCGCGCGHTWHGDAVTERDGQR